MSTLPVFSMRELIDAGVHFGHKTKRWNPRMAPFIYGTRNDVHIIDLQQTVPMLHRAMHAVRSTATKQGRILFVGTKRQASDAVAEAAKRSGQYYVNQRWLGGMLTNWSTILDYYQPDVNGRTWQDAATALVTVTNAYTAPIVNVACLTSAGAVATVSQPCAQYRYENRVTTGPNANRFAAPVEATNINGSLWGVRFGVRVLF